MKKLLLKLNLYALTLIGFCGANSCSFADMEGEYIGFEIQCKVIDSETEKEVLGVNLTPGRLKVVSEDKVHRTQEFFNYGSPVTYNGGVVTLVGLAYENYDNVMHIKLEDIDPEKYGNYKEFIYEVTLELKKSSESKTFLKKDIYIASVTLKAEQVKEK